MVEAKLPTLDQIKKQIPARCFEKSLWRSLYYMFRDFAILAGLYSVYDIVAARGHAALFVWWNLTGFFMWALFVCGHDCGHSSFSNYKWVNDLCGHLCHAPILVPFWPWQKSHRIHHMYHNHLTKDMSHPWLTKEIFETFSKVEEMILECPLSMFVKFTFFYLVAGKCDGSHVYPGSSLFQNTTERIQCAVSTLSVVACASAVYVLLEGDWSRIWSMYLVPILIFNAWITMVTYLQHHDEDTLVFENGEWNYVKGALQTIDRVYGMGIDELTHNITDCHVAHHLFFTQIPHYHLAEASDAVRRVLEPTGLYKRRLSYDFLWKFTELNFKLKYLVGEKVLSFAGVGNNKGAPASATAAGPTRQ